MPLHSHHKGSSTARRKISRAFLALEQLESRTLLSSAPFGSVDMLSRTTAVGWAKNADDGAQALEIDVTVNGVKAFTTANLNRADLATLGSPYHAFTYTLPTLNPGSNSILIEAVSPLTIMAAAWRSVIASGNFTSRSVGTLRISAYAPVSSKNSPCMPA